jgi:hypothetical protein
MLPKGGNAMDPRSPTGGRSGGSSGGGGNSFGDAADRYGQAGWAGLERGFSAGRGGPSKAELAGSLWKGLHPGRDVTDNDPKKKDPPPPPPKKKNPDGTDAGVETADDNTPHGGSKGSAAQSPAGQPKPAQSDSAGGTVSGIAGAVVGAGAGIYAGAQVPVVGEAAAVVLGILGAVGGYYGGQALWKKFGFMPADDGYGYGGGGPRSNVVNLFMPADDGYGYGGGGPRSRGYLGAATRGLENLRAARARPGAPGVFLYKPNPDDPSPGNPNSRTFALAIRPW